MTIRNKDLIERVALFRHSIIARLLPSDLTAKQRTAEMQRIVSQSHTIPGTTRQRVAESTVRHWLRAYHQGGFDALKPRPRADRGEPRSLTPLVSERLVQLKEENPKQPIKRIIETVKREQLIDEHIPVSTVHRLFQHLDLMTPSAPQPVDRRRFAFAQAAQLWMSDVMHGPSVVESARRKRKTYLIAFLDDATRVITHAEFAFSENTSAFLPVFKQALIRRGLPERLYVDNGAAYRSHHLALVCAKLGIALIHAKPFQPQSKGKIERFFRTCRAQLICQLTDEDTASLLAINRRLATWIEGEYHQSPHRGLEGEMPLECWARLAHSVRYPDPLMDLDDLFLFELTRRVNKDRTVSVNGKLYEVDPILIGERVTLRLDPTKPNAPIQVVHNDKLIETARSVDLYANCFVKRHRRSGVIDADGPPPASDTSLSLSSLDTDNNGNGNGNDNHGGNH